MAWFHVIGCKYRQLSGNLFCFPFSLQENNTKIIMHKKQQGYDRGYCQKRKKGEVYLPLGLPQEAVVTSSSNTWIYCSWNIVGSIKIH